MALLCGFFTAYEILGGSFGPSLEYIICLLSALVAFVLSCFFSRAKNGRFRVFTILLFFEIVLVYSHFLGYSPIFGGICLVACVLCCIFALGLYPYMLGFETSLLSAMLIAYSLKRILALPKLLFIAIACVLFVILLLVSILKMGSRDKSL